MPSRAKTFAAGALATGTGYYAGYSLRETSGAAVANVRLWDNASAASGTPLAVIHLASGDSKDVSLNDGGIFFASGVFAEVVAGAVEGAVYFG